MTKMTQEEKDARKTARDLEKEVEHIRSCLEMDKRDTATQNIPDPTLFYKVGERVKYGNWDWSGILEVCEDGRYYKLFSVTWKTGRNVPDCSEHKIHYLPWYDFQPYITAEENENRERFEQDDDIFFSYSQRDMSGLMRYYFSKYGIDLKPEYQRGNVWTLEQKQSLIDSVFRNIDIGKLAIIKRPWGSDGNKPATPKLYEMLDGKQRLTALIEYYTGQFKYRGKYYHELCFGDKNHFKHYTVSIAETDPLTNEQKYRYFLKLNTTGTPVDPEHMAKVTGLLQKEIDKNGG
jgi:hypothetical protein